MGLSTAIEAPMPTIFWRRLKLGDEHSSSQPFGRASCWAPGQLDSLRKET
jgi:hypothetical protein